MVRVILSRLKFLVCSTLLLAAALPAARAGQIELPYEVPPQRSSGTASGTSQASSLSADGRFFVFLSGAPNLVPGQIDHNLGKDVFVYDRISGTATLVSAALGSPVTAGDGPSESAVISADGRWIAFVSTASNLVPGQDDGGLRDVFLYDRTTGTTTLVSRSQASPGLPANGHSEQPALSADGRWIAFASLATDLVDRQADFNQQSDVFLYDRRSGRTTLVSRSSGSATQTAEGESDSPSISADGRYIAFVGWGSLYVHDRVSGTNVLASHRSGSATGFANDGSDIPRISANGECVVYRSSATNLVAGQVDRQLTQDIFLFHRPSGTNTLVSGSSSSPRRTATFESQDAVVSADCRWVAFASWGSDLVARQREDHGSPRLDVFLFERATGKVSIVSRRADSPTTTVNVDSVLGGISADGGQIAFASQGWDLLDPPVSTAAFAHNIFLYDRRSGKSTLVSRVPGAPGHQGGNGDSEPPVLSADGNWVGFATRSSDLDPGTKDLNAWTDVYLYGRTVGSHELVSRRDPDRPSRTPDTASVPSGLSQDGRYAVFTSQANNLLPRVRDTNAILYVSSGTDLFLYDRVSRTATLVSRSLGSPLRTGNGSSFFQALSPDGRFVLYSTLATDVAVGQDPDGDAGDLILYDRTTGTNTLLSPPQAAGSVERSTISADGSTVAYLLGGQLYAVDLATRTTSLISHAFGAPATPADSAAEEPSLSADGRFVAFASEAEDLLSRPPEREFYEALVYVYDRSSRTMTLAGNMGESVGFSGLPPVLSPDGRSLAFGSVLADLVPGQSDGFHTIDLFLFDRLAGTLRLVSHTAGSPTTAAESAFGPPRFSADGRFLIFGSGAPLVEGQPAAGSFPGLYALDLASGAVEAVGSAPAGPVFGVGPSDLFSVSPDGRHVAFTALHPEQPGRPGISPFSHVFLYDRTTRTTTLVSGARSTGLPGAGSSYGPLVATGGSVLFGSYAPDLVDGDFNGFEDVFLYSPGEP